MVADGFVSCWFSVVMGGSGDGGGDAAAAAAATSVVLCGFLLVCPAL